MRLTSTSSSQGTSFTSDQVQKNLQISKSMPTIHKECVAKVQHKSRKCAVVRSVRSLLTFQKGKLKEGGNNVHFTRSSASQKMMVELNGAADDICAAPNFRLS